MAAFSPLGHLAPDRVNDSDNPRPIRLIHLPLPNTNPQKP
jgi:hypothetical protein